MLGLIAEIITATVALFGAGIVIYDRWPQSLKRRRKRRQKQMKDWCQIQEYANAQVGPYGKKISGEWVTVSKQPCRAYPTGRREWVEPDQRHILGRPFIRTEWMIELPVDARVESHHQIVVDGRPFRPVAILGGYTEQEALEILARPEQ